MQVPTLVSYLPKEAGGATSVAASGSSVVVSTASGEAYQWGPTFNYSSMFRPGKSISSFLSVLCYFFFHSFPCGAFDTSSKTDYEEVFNETKERNQTLASHCAISPALALWDLSREWQVTAVAMGTSHIVFLADNGQGTCVV